MNHLHFNEKSDNSLKIDPICIFLTIDFWEILQEYFFVQNQFLILKMIKEKCLNIKFI